MRVMIALLIGTGLLGWALFSLLAGKLKVVAVLPAVAFGFGSIAVSLGLQRPGTDPFDWLGILLLGAGAALTALQLRRRTA